MRRALLLPAVLLAGCGTAAAPSSTQEPAPPAPAASGPVSQPPTASAPPPPPALEPASCPAPPAANCTAHTGRVLSVESVDADGDGDLHVIASGGSVTAPGITVFDVSRSLRPAQDPRPGDRVTGAGPVYRGSFKQRQIQVTTFRVVRAAR